MLVGLRLTEYSLSLNGGIRSTLDTLGTIALLIITIFVWLPAVRKVMLPRTPSWLWVKPKRLKPQA